MAGVSAALLTLGAIFLPETPNSLIQRINDHERAKHMLQHVRGTTDVRAELDDLIKASITSRTIQHPFKNIMRRKYRPQLIMATIGLEVSASLLSSIVTGAVGIASIYAYSR
ncbi:sugar transporter, putative [Ricinus communis]|uniref:Sugar transporter, putative n=1 Tax=Ricinus communis TaxID=3988 RepID=B9R9W4_RICCO|nr:sugar transporter, putative [Ricinus communis]